MMDEKITDFTCELINIPTVSGEAYQIDAYRDISSLVSREMKRIGLDVELIECSPGFINVVGRRTGKNKKRKLLFNGHLDVAPTHMDDWLTNPFKAVVNDGRIWGRGASDMKGGIASMIFGAEEAIKRSNSFDGELILTATVDEEIGGVRGLKYLVEQGLKADGAIVCEPTNLGVCCACKGLMWVKIATRGKEAHGSRPEVGINAIEKIGKIIQKLCSFGDLFLEHKLLGKPTVNIGTISGGTKPNVVPSFCEIEIDVRFLPDQTTKLILEKISEVIQEIEDTNDEINWEFSPIIRERPPLYIKKDEPIIQLIRKATKQVTGEYPTYCGANTPGDSEHLVRAGIPAVMFGPGNDNYAHVANEWIEISEIIKAAEIYSQIVTDFFT
jgi:acetylornithine deacetylase/succinyl-diaminopimelate desuccinylase family protein